MSDHRSPAVHLALAVVVGTGGSLSWGVGEGEGSLLLGSGELRAKRGGFGGSMIGGICLFDAPRSDWGGTGCAICWLEARGLRARFDDRRAVFSASIVGEGRTRVSGPNFTRCRPV